jgi:putative ABC transport system permease protein
VKEIGVRKVLGASEVSIAKLLSIDFIKLVMIAILIASPIAWYAMNYWLEGFTYRVSISGLIFLYAGSIAIAIALATVSFQSIRAAMANPARSLKT